MFVEPDSENDAGLKELRLKQSQCCHPSYVCTCCRLHKDNLQNHYKLVILYLLKKLHTYEDKLDQIDPVYCHVCEDKLRGIIETSTDNPEIDSELLNELIG